MRMRMMVIMLVASSPSTPAAAPATEPEPAAAAVVIITVVVIIIIKASPTAGLLQVMQLAAQRHRRGVEVAVVIVVQGEELRADGSQVRGVQVGSRGDGVDRGER